MSEDFTPAVRNEETAPVLPYVAPTPAWPTTPAVPAGWHPHPQNPGLLLYWDGRAWTDHTAPAHQPAGPAAPVPQQPQQIVIQQSNTMGNYGPHTNHVLHFILTVLTGGLWLFVWIPVAISNNAKRNQMRRGSGNTYYR